MKNKAETSILIIYTGGTIGMVHDPVTGSLVPIDFKHITDHVPELLKFGFDLQSVSFDPVKDSSNIDPSIWVKMAETIEGNYENYNGFVRNRHHGYTASALSFMLASSHSYRSQLHRLRRKSASIEIASARNGLPLVPEVCIYFDNELTRQPTTKLAQSIRAFNSPNLPVGLHLKLITTIRYSNLRKSDR
jgi:L-asparaginase